MNVLQLFQSEKDMKRITAILLSLSLSALCCSPSEKGSAEASKSELIRHQYSAPHLGTIVRLVFYSEDKGYSDRLAAACFQRVKDLDAILSDYCSDSEVSELCAKPVGVPHKVSDALFSVIAQAQEISVKSNGAFDVTLGKLTDAWRKRALSDGGSVGGTSYRDLLLNHQAKTITLQKPLKIDLGGIGKGYIGDQLMQILTRAGISRAAVIIGGETVLAGAPPGKKGWLIGIEDPEHKLIGTIVLANTALSTSGDSYQFFEADGNRHSHLIDPATKQSKINRLNVTTLAPTAMESDAWATALRILPTEDAISIANKQANLEALFIPYKTQTRSTKNFPTLQLP